MDEADWRLPFVRNCSEELMLPVRGGLESRLPNFENP
jgi:hypothetical protein